MKVHPLCSQAPEDLDALQSEAAKQGRQLVVEVIADSSGKFCGNNKRFNDWRDALAYGDDLALRWTLVTAIRIVIAPEPQPLKESA